MSTTDKGEPCFAFVQIREPALRSQANVRVTVISHLEEIGKDLQVNEAAKFFGEKRNQYRCLSDCCDVRCGTVPRGAGMQDFVRAGRTIGAT